jgi:tetratricopeptide (TPR) repeat protein
MQYKALFLIPLMTLGLMGTDGQWKAVSSDSIQLKNGEQLRGLVVEEHEDRVILSTADGEVQVLRKTIAKTEFDDPSYTLLSLGRQLERNKKLGEALSYYEKAIQLNPELTEAKAAAVGVRSKMWAGFTEGPTNEIVKQQEIQDAWRSDTTIEEQAMRGQVEDESLLWKRMGLRLALEGDFVLVSDTRVGGYAHQVGVRSGDVIYAVDGSSMRYIQKPAVLRDLLNPRYASMSLEIRRKLTYSQKIPRTDLKKIGLSLKQEYVGVMVKSVKRGSPSDALGIKNGDRLIRVADENTRYLPLNNIGQAFKSKQGKAFDIEIGRTIQMARQ